MHPPICPSTTRLGLLFVLLALGARLGHGEEPRSAGGDGKPSQAAASNALSLGPQTSTASWWSLEPVRRPAVPELAPAAAFASPLSAGSPSPLRNPIDAFVAAQLAEHGLALAPEADRATYLRRASYDLVGLPATPDEIDAFVSDPSPDAYEKLIDRLLASPHYGERWGRHWLDVVRFGESDGFENDKLREHAWRYRDYVIRSFNDDKPYPQFVREQLAGDVLEPITRDGIVATGFLVAGPWDEIQNVTKSKLEKMRTHEEQIEELIAAVSQTFLGMTVNCARCHDHKFDPIPQTDYYRLKAVFDGTDHGNRPLLTPDEQKALETAIEPLRRRTETARSALEAISDRLPNDAQSEPPGGDGARLVAGAFASALDARRGHGVARATPGYHQPPLTVECWCKLDGKRGFNILVANRMKESSDHWELYSYAGSGVLSAYLPGYEPSEIKSETDITDGHWHYVAMRFDGRRVQLGLDGKRVRDTAVERRAAGGPAAAKAASEPPPSLYFGAYPPQKIGCDGLVDEVRISHALRPIDAVPDRPFTSDDATTGLWHFDTVEQGRMPDAALAAHAADREDLEAQYQTQSEELKRNEAELAAATQVPLTYSGVRRQPEPTVVFQRGDIRKPGAAVTAAALSAVAHPAPELGLLADSPEAERRRRFADWVVHPDNPLTARVMVNRIWQHHFGQGLVGTPSDLGRNGGRPSHPELLDWLAAEFVHPRCGSASPREPKHPETALGSPDDPDAESCGGAGSGAWSIKRMHRLIMLSATYRQAARFDSRAAAVDADNVLLWRFAPRRLEAEIVRDAMLRVSGELNEQIGGASFRPFKVTALLTQFYTPIDPDTPEFNRRTVYRMSVNTGKSPFLDALDCPAPSITSPVRRNTTTPLQALALMNDSFVIRQADRFAARVRREAGEDHAEQVVRTYRLALGRVPEPAEVAATVRLLTEHGLESVCWVLLNSSEFLYVR